MRSHISRGYHRTIFGDGIQFFGHLKHFVERNGRDVESFLEIIVIEVVVSAVLAHIGTHADRVKHKVDRSSQEFNRLRKHFLQVLNTCGIGGDYRGIELLAQSIELSHAQCHGGVTQCDGCAFFYSFHSHFPCDGFFVERTKYNTALAFQ